MRQLKQKANTTACHYIFCGASSLFHSSTAFGMAVLYTHSLIDGTCQYGCRGPSVEFPDVLENSQILDDILPLRSNGSAK